MATGQTEGEFVTELRPCDVLFGRGSGPNDHEGNIRFRQLVAERKQEYLATNHRQTKAKIAREIVSVVFADNGRFLKKVEHFEARRLGIPKGVDTWVTVDDETIMEKAKQALRQNTNKGRPNEAVSASAGRDKAPKETDALPVVARSSGAAIRQDGNAQVEPTPLRFSQKKPGEAGANEIDVQPTPIGGWKGDEDRRVLPVPLNTSSGGQGAEGDMAPPARRGSRKDQFLNAQNQSHNKSQYIVDKLATSSGDIPLDEFGLGRGTMEMSDLMSSMSRLRTRDDKAQESTDTMGTIEPLGQEATRDMSMASFNSSTFSVFNSMRGESVDEMMAISRGASRDNIGDPLGANQKSSISEEEFNVSDVWGSRRGSLLERLIAEERAEAAADAKALSSQAERRSQAIGLMEEPRSLGLMEEEPDSMNNFGTSSMSILKSAFGSAGGLNDS